MIYNGLTTQTVNALNQVSTQLKNSQGWLVRSTDAQGNPVSYAYDSLGNLQAKSDRGSYSYGASHAGPHAVTYTSGVSGGKGAATYSYDANGNQVSGDGRTIRYTSFNVPSQITQGTNTTQFLYDPDHARTRQIATTGGITTTTSTRAPMSR